MEAHVVSVSCEAQEEHLKQLRSGGRGGGREGRWVRVGRVNRLHVQLERGRHVYTRVRPPFDTAALHKLASSQHDPPTHDLCHVEPPDATDGSAA